MVSQIYPPIFGKYKKYTKAINIVTTNIFASVSRIIILGYLKKIILVRIYMVLCMLNFV